MVDRNFYEFNEPQRQEFFHEEQLIEIITK